jgi:hypothetical protein
MFSFKSLSLAAAVGLLLASSLCRPASASVVYDFTYDGKVFDLAGQITVENAPVTRDKKLGDGYKIDSLIGAYSALILGQPIEGDITGLTTTPCFLCKADNILYLHSPFVDSHGIGITTDGFLSFDIFANRADPMHVAVFGVRLFDDPGVFTISAAVPEPSAWAMMILGFISLGFVTYRRRRLAVAGEPFRPLLSTAD